MLTASGAAPTPEAAYRAARAHFDRSDFKAVLADYEAAVTQFGNRDDDALWRLRELRARALLDLGNWQNVLDAASPELPPRLRRSDAAVNRFLALAVASFKLLNFDDAKKNIDAAMHLASTSHHELLPYALFYRAGMKSIFPDQERERDARRALRLANAMHDETLQSKTTGTLGLILANEEHFDEAIDFMERTKRGAEKLGNESLIGKIEGNLGWFYNELGDREAAAEHLQRAVALSEKFEAVENEINDLLQLGDTEVTRGDFDAARRHFAQARVLADKNKSPYRGTARLNLARLAVRSGDFAGARVLNAEAAALNENARDSGAVFESRILDARMAIAGGDLHAARTTLEGVVSGAKSKPIQWEAHGLLAQLFASQRNNDLAEEQFQAAIEKTDEAREEIAHEERSLSFAELSKELNDSYVDFLISIGKPRDALRVAESYRAHSLAGDRDTFEPERVAREANVVILSYWLAAKHSYVWVVKSGGVEVFELPSSSAIESTIDSYQSALLQSRAPDGEGKRLYEMLLRPAAASLNGATRIAIIPDGRIATFNMETVVVPSSHPHYWIEDVTIHRAASLQLLAPSSRAAKSNRLLLIGNAPQADPAFPPLRNASAEIDRVRRHFSETTTLAGAQATPHAYFASKPESFAFLHFVAHGVAVRLQPLDSAVILGRDRDGYKLYARDIAQHPLHARLVTISSCHGAGRRAFKGEGLVGLAWAFMRAGAHEVIASLWEVNDEATPEFMDGMYASIRAGRDPVDALRAAKLKMLHSNTIYKKPLYWAPFVLYSRS